eukprot:COSAG06_NODE_196_length_20472_cov_49.724207_7_plen_76_part_00
MRTHGWPRQARDKYEENSNERAFFRRAARGWYEADINLIDLDAVGEGLPYMVQVRSQCYVHARAETTHRGKKEIK